MSVDEIEKIIQESEESEENTQPLPEPEPCPHFWQFQLNVNHTLIRGCVHCGQADATLVMGDPGDLQWHRIQEPEQGGE